MGVHKRELVYHAQRSEFGRPDGVGFRFLTPTVLAAGGGDIPLPPVSAVTAGMHALTASST